MEKVTDFEEDRSLIAKKCRTSDAPRIHKAKRKSKQTDAVHETVLETKIRVVKQAKNTS